MLASFLQTGRLAFTPEPSVFVSADIENLVSPGLRGLQVPLENSRWASMCFVQVANLQVEGSPLSSEKLWSSLRLDQVLGDLPD